MNEIYQEKLHQAVGYLQENNIDLWLVFASEGSDPAVQLLTGLKTVGRTFFFITRQKGVFALCSQIDAQESEESKLFDRVERYTDDAASRLLELVEELNPASIAINYSEDDHLCDGLTTGRYRWLCKAVGEKYAARFVPSTPMLQRIRAIKTPAELSCIQTAIDMTLEIYDEVFAQMHAGMTERQVGQLFVDGMRKRNVVEGTSKELTMPIVMKDRISHRGPSDEVIVPGDFLIMDWGVDYQGYVSDIARTVYFLKEGETCAPQQMEESFQAAYDAITAGFEAAKPGVRGIDVDTAARQYLLSKGMPEVTHSVGHQIGRCTHDGGTMFAPAWERYGDSPYGILEAGMTFTLEPTILRETGYSILTEENIVITEDGARFLSRRQDHVILIG
ncbi:MAG: Xaa-Pro peptidase family protein [Angelakisella sp.]|nr:Xaa-Pro peptidase family protein [Angelakisella sp.]